MYLSLFHIKTLVVTYYIGQDNITSISYSAVFEIFFILSFMDQLHLYWVDKWYWFRKIINFLSERRGWYIQLDKVNIYNSTAFLSKIVQVIYFEL